MRDQREEEKKRGYELPRRGKERREEEFEEGGLPSEEWPEESKREDLWNEGVEDEMEGTQKNSHSQEAAPVDGEKEVERSCSRKLSERKTKGEDFGKGLRRKNPSDRATKRPKREAKTVQRLQQQPREVAATISSNDNFPNSSTERNGLTEPDSGMGREPRKKEGVSDSVVAGTLVEIFKWLDSRLDGFLDRLCKTMPTGRIFPLPSSCDLLAQMFPQSSPDCRLVLRCLVGALNSLNGEGLRGSGKASELQCGVLGGLLEDCERVLNWSSKEALPSWKEFLRVRGVDYKGDEVLTAQTMRWENVAPALPEEVGTVSLEEVVEFGSLHYVQNFQEYLLDVQDRKAVKPPKVMVPPENWEVFCENLLNKGVFSRIHEDDIFRVEDQLLLNGLFGVSKGEFSGTHEVQRLIMNLIPLNEVVRGLDGDVSTLPAWSGMTPLQLHPHEDLVISSEDVRCFFYIFKVPTDWHPFLAFNRPLPPKLSGDNPGRWYPCSAVLPMGFKNSVALAQHVHRVVVNRAVGKVGQQGAEAELRKDRSFTVSNPCHRVYLDNFDQLERVNKDLSHAIQGKVSPLVLGLREEYAALGIPRHPKKAVATATVAEVQGAMVDGQRGLAHPKVEKVLKYMHLARLLLEEQVATQKQMQIVGGGLVYIAMFRRPLLGGLNHIWQFIVQCEGYPPVIRFPIPDEVKQEIARFIGLVPLAYMDFRAHISPMVTASDASTTGGGVTASVGLTPVGCVASTCDVRGDIVEPSDLPSVLTIGLFDGIGALRVAADCLGWCVAGHVSVEKDPAASRVVEARFPNALHVNDVASVDQPMVADWAAKFSQVSVVVIGAGPPCQGVSGLNAARKGALKDSRSSLFSHVQRIKHLVAKNFPWAQVRSLMESVASMDQADEQVMSDSFGSKPFLIDACHLSLGRRPRLYWTDWELRQEPDVKFSTTEVGRQQILLKAQVDPRDYIQEGWRKASDDPFPTFTTSRPRPSPGYKPAGFKQCQPHEVERWRADQHRFPPYQYQDKHCLVNRAGEHRLPSIREREVIMGFPRDYTLQCLPKRDQGSQFHLDTRLSLIGNSWNVTVVTWILGQLGSILGLNPFFTLEEIVKRSAPGCSVDLSTFLYRPLLNARRSPKISGKEIRLVEKLLTLVSMKGEDLLLQSSSEDLTKYHRLRSSIPSKLWKWKTVAGWHWNSKDEHINALECRATLTALRWRLERLGQQKVKFVHLVDSLVVLHCLSRGRSSSRKLRRTVLRINALLLATRSQAVWAYVHTKDNPADAPSRRPQKRKWTGCQRGI